LARKSFVIPSREHLLLIAHRGGGLFIDGVDGEALHRAYVDQLQTLMREEKSIGEIADSRLSNLVTRKVTATGPEVIDWLDLQVQAHHLLRDTNSATFLERLQQIHQTLGQALQRNPDGTLFALIYLSASETKMYSATHSMLVSVMCALASHDVLNWPEPIEAVLRKAALTMNLSMTDLQDRLTLQVHDPDESQRSQIATHAQRSAERLLALGVSDEVWLEVVREHHTASPGPLAAKRPALRLARLIERADMFSARLSPRVVRPPISPAAAMQACYFDENKQVDEAGAALIKAVGIYPPGTFVKLATNEIGIVIRRGSNTSTPRVAVVLNRSGVPTVEPAIRDTSLKELRVVASVPHREMKVQIQLERMLALTQAPAAERPW
jgi:HD-GYP domain-containing protein (c-di-GMP phosphodiesterase class II)